MIEEMRRASILKKKLYDEVDYQEGRDMLMTIIEQNFTNFNRCLFIIKIESIKKPVGVIQDGPKEREINFEDRKFAVSERTQGANDRSNMSAAGSKFKYKISSSKLKEGLSSFMFDMYADDQRYQSRHR